MNKRTLLISAESAKPYASRELIEVAPGQSIFEILEGQGLLKFDPQPKRIGYYVVVVNGKSVLQAEWNTILADTDVIQIIHLPMGGGGSNIGMILVTVIAVAAAVFTGGASLGVAAAWGAAAGAAVGVLSSMVPTAATNPSSMDRESASSTYSISSQNNSARLLEAIPVLYGRMRMYPDLAAQPYTENTGNLTYLYQLFCVTQGTLDIEKLMIEDSDISSFGEVQYEVIPPGGKVTLFPSNVVTSEAVQGLELKGPNEEGYSVMGPFVSSPSGTTTNKLAVDVTFPQGAYAISEKGKMGSASASFQFSARLIDDKGAPIGNWFTLGQHTETFSTQTAQMLTYRYDVPEGRYEVEGNRTSDASTDTKVASKLQWTGLRAYLKDDNEYGNVTLVAMIIQATNNLNSNTSRRFNLIGTRKLQTWDPVNGFSPAVATRNPAWAFVDALRNADYGASYAPSKINMAEVYRLSKVWEQRGDTFNAVFDTTQTLWESLSQICAVGRATPIYYAGQIDLVRDEPRTLETALFHPGNIVQNSFSTVYKFPTSQTPDHVIIQYFDEETWQADEVVCALPGSAKLVPSTVEMFGITKRDQAWREGMYKAAVNRDQRRRINFNTELEGLLPKFGDVIGLAHDVPGWGQTGYVVSLDRSSGKIVTTEPLVWDANASQHQIVFQKANGKADGPYTIRKDSSAIPGVNSAIVVATAAQLAAIRISDGIRTDYTIYNFGASDRTSLKAVILATKPSNNGQVAITATNYADGPHIAENGGAVPPPGPVSNLPGVTVGPVIDSVQVLATPTVGQQQIVATAARGAIQYEFQARQGTDNWSQLGLGPNPFMFVNLSAAVWQVRVRAIGALPGPWATWEGQVEMTSIAIPPITAFAATTNLLKSIRLDWTWGDGADLLAAYAQVYYSLTNVLGDAIPFRDTPYPATSFIMDGLKPGDQFFFWIRPVDTAGRTGPWFSLNPTVGRPTTDSRIILDDIAGEIREDDLFKELQDKINLVTAPIGVPGSVSDRIKEAQDELQAAIDAVQDEIDNIGDLADAQEYKADKAYDAGMIVTKANGLWQAKIAVPAKADGSNGPPNATYWRDAGGIIKEGDGLASRVTSQGQTITQQGTAITTNSNDITQLKSSVAGKADASALSALTTRVSTAEGKIDSQGQSITSLTNTVNGKADASALTALTNRVTATEGSISSQGQAITSLQNTVAGKADSSAVTALASRVTTAEGAITSQGSSITQLTNNIGNAGGENLLYNPSFVEPTPASPNLPLGWNTDGGTGIDATYNATWSTVTSWLDSSQKSARIDFKGVNENSKYFSFATNQQYRAYASAGQQLACSGYVRGTAGMRMRIFIQAINASGVAISAPVSDFFVLTTAGARISYSATMPDGTVRISVFFRVYGAANGAGDGYVELSRAQLEVGAVATGWRDNSKVLAAAQSATATALQTLSNTVTQQGNTITSQSGSITSLTNSVKGAVQQAFNMIPNPTFDPAFNTLGFYIAKTTDAGVPANCPFPYAARIRNRDNVVPFDQMPNFPVKTGDVYRISALLAAEANSGTRPFQHYLFRGTSALAGQAAFANSPPLQPTQTWTRHSWDFTVPAGTNFMRPFLQIETGSDGSTTTWYVTDWHCENITAAKNAQNTADATATAVTALTTRVSSAEGSITSQGQAITRLQSDIAGVGAFVAAQNFEFLNSNRGFYMEQAASGATLTAYQQNLTINGYANLRSPTFPELNGVQNPILRMRIRRNNTTRGVIRIYWANEDGGLSEDRTATANINLTSNDWQNIEFDLSANIAWVTKTKITSIRFDCLNPADTSAILDFAWIAVGRKGPAASATAVSSLETTVTQQGSTLTAQGTSITQLTSRVGSAESAIQTEAKTRADADSANATNIQTVQTNLNGTNSTVQTLQTTVTDINGKMSAAFVVKVGLTSDGKYYTAGMGIGIDKQSNGVIQSKVYVATDRFAVIGAGAGGEDLFVVEGGRAYMNTAFINKAYINQAIVGQNIFSSNTTQQGYPIMNVDFSVGAIYIRSEEAQLSEIQMDRAAVRCYVSGRLRVRFGRW